MTVAHRPCEDGGQPARAEKPPKFLMGKRQCEQAKDTQGRFQNNGTYREWYANGILALEGEYKWGMKTGKWIEWDQQGKLVSEKWFEKGEETVPVRTVGPSPVKAKQKFEGGAN